MPNAILEAVANGIPVLASDIPAHREILPPDQLLSLNRPERWLSAIGAMMDDPVRQREQMASTQTRFTRHLLFDWDTRVVEVIVLS